MKKIFLIALILSCKNNLKFTINSKADVEKALKVPLLSNFYTFIPVQQNPKLFVERFIEHIDDNVVIEKYIIMLKKMLEDIFNDDQAIINGAPTQNITFITDMISEILIKGNKKDKEKIKNIFNYTTSENMNLSLLMYASKFYDTKFVQILVAIGMDVNYMDKYKTTSLMYAASRTDLTNDSLIQCLLKAGAKKHLINENGQTALTIAEEINNKFAISLLKDSDI